MKIFTNLPGILRAFFNVLRLLTVVAAVLIVVITAFVLWAKSNAGDAIFPLLVGEVRLGIDAKTLGLGLHAAGASPRDLILENLRGDLLVNVISREPAMVSAYLQAFLPLVMFGLTFAWFGFGYLRDLCANVERGEVFSEKNVRLVRSLGFNLTVYSLVEVAAQIWSRLVMGAYINKHVVLTGLEGVPRTEKLTYIWPPDAQASFVGYLFTGLLVLVLCEAFRQGLSLKAENDLTV